MSKLKEVEILTHAEVIKKIIEKPPKVISPEELLGPYNRYRDENFQIYNKKKKQFLDTCKKYNKLNEENLFCNKTRLSEDYRRILDCEFLMEEKEEKNMSDQGNTGKVVRKRTKRSIFQVKPSGGKHCTTEPWFIRYKKLNKFIWAARTIILKNRLLKVLEKLRTVTEEDIENLEKQNKPYLNVSYAEIFEKFV